MVVNIGKVVKINLKPLIIEIVSLVVIQVLQAHGGIFLFHHFEVKCDYMIYSGQWTQSKRPPDRGLKVQGVSFQCLLTAVRLVVVEMWSFHYSGLCREAWSRMETTTNPISV